MSAQETPRPPATAEFGAVTPGGPAHDYPASGCLQVKKLSVGRYDNNVYILRCARSGDALLVDAADEAGRLIAELEGARLTAIVETHGHFDHVQALAQLVERTGARAYAHREDAAAMPVTTEPLEDGQALAFGHHEARVLHTPGHTPGSVCLLVDGFLMSGDTLFPAGPGNTDGDPARFEEVMRSLGRLFELPDETRVLPGHGIDTTIGRERPHVETWRVRGW